MDLDELRKKLIQASQSKLLKNATASAAGAIAGKPLKKKTISPVPEEKKPNLAKTFADSLMSAPRAYVRPIVESRLQKQRVADLSQGTSNLLSTASKLRSRGNLEGAKRLEETARKIGGFADTEGQEYGKQAFKDVGKSTLGGAGTVFTALGIPKVTAGKALVATGLGGGISKAFGGEFSEGAAKALGSLPRILGFVQFTDPVTQKFVSQATSLPALQNAGLGSQTAKQLLGRTISGIGNVIEDEGLAFIDDKKPGVADRVTSFAIAFVMSPQSNKDFVDNFIKNETQGLNKQDSAAVDRATRKAINKAGRYFDKSTGRFMSALEARADEKVKFVGDMRQEAGGSRFGDDQRFFGVTFKNTDADQLKLGEIEAAKLNPGPDTTKMSVEQAEVFGKVANDVRSGNFANRPGDPKTEQINETIRVLWDQFKKDETIPKNVDQAITELQKVANKGVFGSSFDTVKASDDFIPKDNGVDGKVKASDTDIPKEKVPPRVVEQTFKTEKFNLDENTEKVLKAAQKGLGMEVRDVKSFEDMQMIADELGTNPTQLLKDIDSGRVTSDEILALGDTISTSAQRVSKLADDLKADPDNVQIRAELEAEERLMNDAIKKRIRGGTEAGRAVVAFRKIANNTLDRTYWLDKAQRQIGVDKDIDTDVVKAIDEFIEDKDRLGLAVFISKLGESSGAEKAIALWKAGLLTGLRTHEANIISNTAFGFMETIKDIPATAFDIVRSSITGEPRAKTFGLDQITKQGEGAARGTEHALTYIKEGVDPRDLYKAELYEPVRFGDSSLGNIAQKYTDAVFGTLGAEDKIFREAAVARSLAEQTSLKGINEGLSVAEMDDLYKNPTPEMLDEAMEDALYATFNKQSKIADAVSGAKRSGPGARTAIDVVAPFVRTPTNVAEALFDYTPAGFAKDLVKQVVNGSVSDKRLAESFGRAVTGTAIIWIGAELAKRGFITGSYPESRSEAAQRNLEGKQSNAIFLNGKWRALSRVSPIGNLLLLGAEYHDAEGSLINTGFSGIKSLSEQTFLRGASQALKAVTEPDRYAESFGENFVAGFVPSFINDTGRATDEFIRDTEGIKQKIQARIPGLREALPAKLDPLGQPIKQQPGGLMAYIDPFNSRVPNEDSLVQEFSRVGYNLNYVGDRLNNEKLTQAQKLEYQRVAGQKIREIVPSVINSPAYQGSPEDVQRDLIEKAVNKAKSIAREDVKSRLNEIEDQGIGVEASDEIKLPTQQSEIQEQTSEVSPYSSTTFVDGEGSVKTISIQKVLDMPDKSSFDKAKKLKASYDKARDIVQEDLIDPQVAEAMIQEMGLDIADVQYYDLANEDNDLKSIFVKETIGGIQNREQMIDSLVQMRREVQGKMVLTSGVIDDLVDAEIISYEEGKILKKTKFDENGVPQVKKSGRGGGAKLKSIKFIPVDFTSGRGASIPSIRGLQAPRIPSEIPVAFRQPTAQVAVPTAPQFKVDFNL